MRTAQHSASRLAVGLYRVSTAEQGQSGLGLEAQQASVRAFVVGQSWTLVREFSDIASGKDDRRPGFRAALARCRQLGAVLVAARLDRITRRAHTLSQLLEDGYAIRAADMPGADELMLRIYTAMAQKGRELIRERTRAALAAAQARASVLGGDRGYRPAAGPVSGAAAVARRQTAEQAAHRLHKKWRGCGATESSDTLNWPAPLPPAACQLLEAVPSGHTHDSCVDRRSGSPGVAAANAATIPSLLRFPRKNPRFLFQEEAMRAPSYVSPTPDRSNAAVVVSKAVVRAAAALGVTNAGLAKVLGVSPATASRLREGVYVLPLDGKPYEFALLLIRLFRGLDAMMGGEEQARQSWMQTPNRALDGAPVDRITSVTGLVETVAYVDAARARV